MKEKFSPQLDNQRQTSPEAAAGPIGLPPPVSEQEWYRDFLKEIRQEGAEKRLKEKGERQPLRGALDLLEHRVKVYTPDPNRPYANRVRQKQAVNRWTEGLRKKGTDRDRLIIDLYTSITVQPGYGERSIRELSLEEFPQFRSRVEPMSEEEIAVEIRKEEEAKQRKIEESRKTNNPNWHLTLDAPEEIIHEPPNWALGTFS